MHVDHIGLGVEMDTPYLLEQHAARDDLIRVAHQKLEKIELARLQRNFASGAMHLARQEIKHQIADRDPRLDCDRVGTTRNCLEARIEFRRVERFS